MLYGKKKFITNKVLENINNYYKFEELVFLKFLIRMLMYEVENKNMDDYNDTFSINEAFDISFDFLKSINLLESIYLDEIDFIIVKPSNKKLIKQLSKEKIFSSSYKQTRKEKQIILFIKNNLDDVYTIVHELIHYICYKYYKFEDESLSEILSMCSELFLRDYLIKNGISNDYDIHANYRSINTRKISNFAKYDYINLSQIETNGKIDIRKIDRNLLDEYVSVLKISENLCIDGVMKYLYGFFFGSHIHRLNDIDLFKYLSLNIYSFSFKKLILEIGLSLEGMDLTDDSYGKVFEAAEIEYNLKKIR